MNREGSLEKYNSMPVSKAILINAIPAMVSMLMTLIYNLADTFFIGQIHDAYQVAAASLAMPVFLLFMALGTVFGIGGASVIARAAGEGRLDHARRVCAFCLWGGVISGLALMSLFLLFMDPMLSFLGASKDTWAPTKAYLTIVTYCGPFVVLSNDRMFILRAEGEASRAMTGQIIGNALNIILDPIMILGLRWNIVGAAVATVIGNVCAAGYYLSFYLRGKSSLSIRLRDASSGDHVASGVLAIGIPAALGSVLMSLSQILMNGQMARYGDMALAGMGIAMRIVIITGMISMGIGQGVQPLLGYCVGAKQWDRYRKLMNHSLLFAFLLSLSLAILCYVFSRALASLFLTDPEALGYAVRFARILLSTSFLFGIYYVLTNALQAMGAATSAFIINLSRQGIIYLPALFALHAALGMPGLVWAQPAADVLSVLLALVLYRIAVERKRIASASLYTALMEVSN